MPWRAFSALISLPLAPPHTLKLVQSAAISQAELELSLGKMLRTQTLRRRTHRQSLWQRRASVGEAAMDPAEKAEEEALDDLMQVSQPLRGRPLRIPASQSLCALRLRHGLR